MSMVFFTYKFGFHYIWNQPNRNSLNMGEQESLSLSFNRLIDLNKFLRKAKFNILSQLIMRNEIQPTAHKKGVLPIAVG